MSFAGIAWLIELGYRVAIQHDTFDTKAADMLRLLLSFPTHFDSKSLTISSFLNEHKARNGARDPKWRTTFYVPHATGITMANTPERGRRLYRQSSH